MFVLRKFTPILKRHHAYALFAGFLAAAATMGYYELSLNGGEASIVSPLLGLRMYFLTITGLYVVIPTALGLLFLKEKKTAKKFAGITCSCISIMLLALGGSVTGWNIFHLSNLIYFCISFIGWGIGYFLRGLASKSGDFSALVVLATLGQVIGTNFLVLFRYGSVEMAPTIPHFAMIASGFFGILGELGFFLLSKEGEEASVVVPLTGGYVLVAAILGLIFLHESVTVFKIIGIVISVTSLVLLGIK
jgi:uncharacterized membrane protein